ncbi:hypothetical protein PTI98_006340 [Pleurotus ostreatus]|nr:hypothetical protein PTI98_006340 [Pleurotus ostreatus]
MVILEVGERTVYTDSDNSVHRWRSITVLVSRFAWIPFISHISADKVDVHIEGYINGLGPQERLHRLLMVFTQLERTIEWEYSFEESASAKQAQEAEEENDVQQETEQGNHDPEVSCLWERGRFCVGLP